MSTDTPPPISGPGVYFDGHTGARYEVTVRLATAAMEIVAPDGRVVTNWPYDQIDELNAPDKVLRLGRHKNPILERLEIFDASFAEALDVLAIHVDRTGALQRAQHKHAVVLALAATVSLLLAAVFVVPAIATRMAPFVPIALDSRIGAVIDVKARAEYKSKYGADFECGLAPSQRRGRAALDKIMRRLERAAGLALPSATVVRTDDKNAFAAPGGRIYLLDGLIRIAGSADEIAGPLAHEIGHVAHRDGTRKLLATGGLSLMFGMLLGDSVGGGMLVASVRSVLENTYSRDVEAAADAYGAELMIKAGGDPRGLSKMLTRMGGATEPGMKILLDHPLTKARVAAIERIAATHPSGDSILDDDEWAALRAICKR